MARWENDIFGMVSPTDWIDVGAADPTRQNDPIDGLFGDEKTDNLVAEWENIASDYQIPVMAQFHGFDTEANTAYREPIDHYNIEKGLIKVKMPQSERLRALTKNVTSDDALYEYVLKDGIKLADRVITRTKVAKNELMATGEITIKENNLDLTVDYGVPNENKSLTLDVGAGAQEDILTQIQRIIDTATANGTIITGIMTSKSVLTKMRKNEALQSAIYGTAGSGSLIRNSDFTAFLNEEFQISRIITNDLTYAASEALDSDSRPLRTFARYYPTNKITFFATNPAGKMGIGLWGDPPEADNYGLLNVSGSEVSPYVYITQWMENDPAVLWTKASSLFMPVLYNPYSLYIATISETPSA